MALNPAQIRAFHAVAATGKFTTAARTLHVTQPTLSNQVAALESRFDVRLFDRTPRGVSLTPIGERLFELTQRHFALAEEAERLLRASGTLTGGFIRVGTDGPHHMMPVVAEFGRAFPDVEVSVQMGNADTMMGRLVEGRLDVAIVGRRSADPRYHFDVFRRSAIVCFVAREHRWASHAGVTLAELAGAKLILRESGSQTRRIFEDAFRERGLRAVGALEIETREAVREAVAAGLGVGIVSRAELDVDPRVVVLPIVDATLEMTEYVACLRERERLSVVRAFLDAALSVAARLGSG